jgi:hypothetical protein
MLLKHVEAINSTEPYKRRAVVHKQCSVTDTAQPTSSSAMQNMRLGRIFMRSLYKMRKTKV